MTETPLTPPQRHLTDGETVQHEDEAFSVPWREASRSLFGLRAGAMRGHKPTSKALCGRSTRFGYLHGRRRVSALMRGRAGPGLWSHESCLRRLV